MLNYSILSLKIEEIVKFGNANELGFEYVGEKITEVLERYGKTLREVARAIGMKPSTLQTTIDGNPTIGGTTKSEINQAAPIAVTYANDIKNMPWILDFSVMLINAVEFVLEYKKELVV